MVKVGAVLVLCGVALSACLSDDPVNGQAGPPPECGTDADCTHLDTDEDPCTVVKCEIEKCVPRTLTNTTECQCATDADCIAVLGGQVKDCATAVCTDHQCAAKIAPAGPAPRQTPGDCGRVTCDGASSAGKREIDTSDIPDDQNPCTSDSCTAGGETAHASQADGATCGDGSICFNGQCVACKPQNATSCGGEGPNEPANDTGTSASAYSENLPVCGFSSGDDVDWYTFYGKDDDLTRDVIRFKFWSTAATIEACFYVKCDNGGTPEGGCTDLKDGPNGSRGCCYTGAPASVSPNWDLDCTNTTEDSGTIYVSVRTPGGSACERYTMAGGY